MGDSKNEHYFRVYNLYVHSCLLLTESQGPIFTALLILLYGGSNKSIKFSGSTNRFLYSINLRVLTHAYILYNENLRSVGQLNI